MPAMLFDKYKIPPENFLECLKNRHWGIFNQYLTGTPHEQMEMGGWSLTL